MFVGYNVRTFITLGVMRTPYSNGTVVVFYIATLRLT